MRLNRALMGTSACCYLWPYVVTTSRWNVSPSVMEVEVVGQREPCCPECVGDLADWSQPQAALGVRRHQTQIDGGSASRQRQRLHCRRVRLFTLDAENPGRAAYSHFPSEAHV